VCEFEYFSLVGVPGEVMPTFFKLTALFMAFLQQGSTDVSKSIVLRGGRRMLVQKRRAVTC
jgi:hypothetical protein